MAKFSEDNIWDAVSRVVDQIPSSYKRDDVVEVAVNRLRGSYGSRHEIKVAQHRFAGKVISFDKVLFDVYNRGYGWTVNKEDR